jgi:hypothetical protein
MTEPFYTKRRLAAVKDALRENPGLEHEGAADLELRTFLIDMADNIARLMCLPSHWHSLVSLVCPVNLLAHENARCYHLCH